MSTGPGATWTRRDVSGATRSWPPANEVFAKRGFRGASLATIAKRVGMSEPGLLHHFASKEELLLELLKLRDQHDDERIAEARAAHARGLDVLLALCRQNEERPGIVRLFTILAAESLDADHPAHDWFLDRYRDAPAHPRRTARRRAARGPRRPRPRPGDARAADPRDVRRPADPMAPGPRQCRHGRGVRGLPGAVAVALSRRHGAKRVVAVATGLIPPSSREGEPPALLAGRLDSSSVMLASARGPSHADDRPRASQPSSAGGAMSVWATVQ